MVRTVTTFDAEWTEEDLVDALDWQSYEDSLCTGCGGLLAETMDPDRTRAYDAEIVRCHRCAAGDVAERMYRADNGDPAGIRRRTFERTPMRPPPVSS